MLKKDRNRVVSLFSGAGGLDLGFVDQGFKIIWANDNDVHACNTYANNIGNHIEVGSILDLKEKIPNEFDVLIGGPPCQGFSVAGKMDPHDTRSKLIWEFANVVEQFRPRAFVMENVKALGKLSKWEPTRNELLKRFTDLGYGVSCIVLNASLYGVPQSRERVFFIGLYNDKAIDLEAEFNKRKEIAPLTKDVLNSLGRIGSETNPNTCAAKITLTDNPVLRKSPYAGMLFNGLGRPVKLQGYCQTLPASMGGNKTPIIDDLELYEGYTSWTENYHKEILSKQIAPDYTEAPKRLRRMSIIEAAAIQTFPSDYKWTGSKSTIYKQIGNAVPPRLAFHVAGLIKDVLQSKEIRRKKNSFSYQHEMILSD
jgi:DNA (cytosine-5)-methyltransferase 1